MSQTNEIMKKSILIFTLLLLTTVLYAQDKKPIFLGLQPAITQEPFYDKGEFDINIIPLTVEFPVSKSIDLRFTSIVNYHIGGKEGVSDLGLQLVAPVFFLDKREAINTKSGGFYLGPLLGFGRNLLNDHYTTTVGVEPGYLFKTEEKFTLSLGLQFGGSYFSYDTEPNVWHNHFGFKINLGWWLS